MHSLDILLIIAALVLSTGITGLMRVYAKRSNLLDVPNQRSSHQVATHRGGGLSIVVVFLGAVIGLYNLWQFTDRCFFFVGSRRRFGCGNWLR